MRVWLALGGCMAHWGQPGAAVLADAADAMVTLSETGLSASSCEGRS